MSPETHSQLADFIWKICNLLRGPYKRNEYRKVILPLTVLRRFDCLLASTKDAVLRENARLNKRKNLPVSVRESLLTKASGQAFYNDSELGFERLLDDPNNIAQHLVTYINRFSEKVREIFERFAFDQQIARMNEKDLLYQVIKAFAGIDL